VPEAGGGGAAAAGPPCGVPAATAASARASAPLGGCAADAALPAGAERGARSCSNPAACAPAGAAEPTPSNRVATRATTLTIASGGARPRAARRAEAPLPNGVAPALEAQQATACSGVRDRAATRNRFASPRAQRRRSHINHPRGRVKCPHHKTDEAAMDALLARYTTKRTGRHLYKVAPLFLDASVRLVGGDRQEAPRSPPRNS
jgi:hypothetical protein